ncbi:MAG: acyltransferase family protein, partial [Actinomycetota bacterium]
MGESRGLAYVPALDGIRALSVLLVMAFHLEVAGFAGGFLPVSLFFTLSGYLITQLILDEFDSTGRFSLLDFWSRRFRRLMPAALLGIAIVAGLAVAIESLRSPRLRGDLGAALGYVANWRFASSSQTYADLFSNGASPVQHFWSLAIEEQFYVVFPLLMAGLLVRARRSVGFVLAGLMVMCVVAGLLADSRNLIYYGTHVRAAELLAGAVLATLLPIGRAISTRVAKAFAIAASAGVVALGVAVATVSIDDGIVYSGGLAAFSLVSVAVILGSLVPGPVNWLMSRRPLVAIGRVSYGLYVFHWPVIVVLDEQRMGFGGFGLVLVRVAVTVAITVLSYFLIENPVRRRRVLVGFRRAATAAGGAVVAVVATILIVPQFTVPVLAGLDAPDEVVSFGAPEIAAAVPTVRVAFVGGDDVSLPESLPDGTLVDVVRPDPISCPLRAGLARANGCGSVVEALADAVVEAPVAATVLTVGRAERALLTRLVGDPSAHDLLERPWWRDRQFTVAADYVATIATAVGQRRVIVIDLGPADALGGELAEWGARSENVTVLPVESADAVAATLEPTLVEAISDAPDDRTRVLVIGDSTSFGLAEALDTVAGDELNVLWAGGRNCPLAAVERVRWWGDVAFDLSACPRADREWATIILDFAPALVLMVYSVPQQAEQQYEKDG